MEPSTTEFVAQLKGRLTKRRYRVATVFVDHYFDLSYVHLHSSTASEEIVEAKRAFEAYARDHGVNIEHYHADNGRFADNLFVQSIRENKQTISYCSVNAHHQNGRAEKRIRDLKVVARTQLLHTISRWPQAVNTHLWPYALRNANDIRNKIADKKDGTSPLERFLTTSISHNTKHFHTFGCPVYALDNRLASRGKIQPWQSRSRPGINLGPSPRHARDCALVMDPNTGLVSPQFHVSFDEFFETTRTSAANTYASPWQRLAGFSHSHNNIASEGDVQHTVSSPETTQSTYRPAPSLQSLGEDYNNNASSSEYFPHDLNQFPNEEPPPSDVPTQSPPVEQETTNLEQSSFNVPSDAPTNTSDSVTQINQTEKTVYSA